MSMPPNEQDVKARRRYESSVRTRQRLATRAAVLAAAEELFVARGYDGTSIAAVAAEAGVSAQTVYETFGNKPGLLRDAVRVATMGTQDSLFEPSWVEVVAAVPDQAGRWALMRTATTTLLTRTLPLAEVVRAAGRSHPEVAELWNELEAERRGNVEQIVDLLADVGPLRTTRDDAVDLVWAMGRSTDLFAALVHERDWPPEKAFAAVSDAIAGALFVTGGD
jgi:AcrR family transcriptional regulator